MKHIKGTLACTAFQADDTGMWIGECDTLDIVLEAKNLDELYSLFSESIALLFSDLEETGDIHKFLIERGFVEEKKTTEITSLKWQLTTKRKFYDFTQAAA